MSNDVVHSERIGPGHRHGYSLAAGLSVANRRWIVRYALLMTAVINLVVNGVLAWLTTIGSVRLGLIDLPLLGAPSLVTNTVGTLVILPVTTSVMCSAGVRRFRQRGLIDPVTVDAFGPMRWIDRLPSTDLRAGLVLAAISVGLLAPGCCAVLVGLASGGVTRETFVIYNAVLGVALGAVVTPVVAVRAMAEDIVATGPVVA